MNYLGIMLTPGALHLTKNFELAWAQTCDAGRGLIVNQNQGHTGSTKGMGVWGWGGG